VGGGGSPVGLVRPDALRSWVVAAAIPELAAPVLNRAIFLCTRQWFRSLLYVREGRHPATVSPVFLPPCPEGLRRKVSLLYPWRRRPLG
jgi:hypothetical protein